MKFKIDHDYHIHSKLSLCSNDDEQTTANILKYAERNNLSEICLTDHFWDSDAGTPSDWYAVQNYEHITAALPLPESNSVKFYFGCEVDMDKNGNVGIHKKNVDKFDFIIVPTTHLHMGDFTLDESDRSLERRAVKYIDRIHSLMDADLPFEKIGLAHPTCPLLADETFEAHLAVLDMISDNDYKEAFKRVAEKGVGFELNFTPANYSEADLPRVLRPYKIAKEVGCKFYLGSDSHHPKNFEKQLARATDAINLLELTEEDKFRFHK